MFVIFSSISIPISFLSNCDMSMAYGSKDIMAYGSKDIYPISRSKHVKDNF
jgi:hypothetical protein